ncbi:MAG: DUF4338 domain-containing protein [Candidatus Schekmanbacteria bacterium]|nr:DUF4338 domain-containing protein [Candidatus Schekmanbacteria bacterium]
METIFEYRGRRITDADVALIRGLVAANPEMTRRALSRDLCRRWGWIQENGALRDGVCRGLLLSLWRAGHLELPAPRWSATRPPLRQRRLAPLDIDTGPLLGRLQDLGEIRFRQVRRAAEEPLLHALIADYHYLGYTRPVGEHLKFLAAAGARPVACFVWSSAPRHLSPRDRYLGWSAETRRQNLHLVAYNSRFLILPWVQVPHLASHLLARMTRMLPAAWQAAYGHPVWYAETFVDPTRFRGTCYRAASWVWLGRTTGRGKDDQTGRPNRSLKDVLGLPLHRRFRALLTRRS